MDNLEKEIREAESARVKAEEERVQAEQLRAHSESNQGSGRQEHETGREVAEEERVEEALGRQEAEELRQAAEEARIATHEKYLKELHKLETDPDAYVTPGAKRIFRKFTAGYVILAIAAIIGVLAIQNETDNRVKDINISRAQINYDSCLEQNQRNSNTVNKLNSAFAKSATEINNKLIEAQKSGDVTAIAALKAQLAQIDRSRNTSIGLIDALAPARNCEEFVKERFGFVPKPDEPQEVNKREL